MSVQINENSPFWQLLVVGHGKTVTCEDYEAQIKAALEAKEINPYEFDELIVRHRRMCWNKKNTDKLNF
jgi:hypothetical protein